MSFLLNGRRIWNLLKTLLVRAVALPDGVLLIAGGLLVALSILPFALLSYDAEALMEGSGGMISSAQAKNGGGGAYPAFKEHQPKDEPEPVTELEPSAETADVCSSCDLSPRGVSFGAVSLAIAFGLLLLFFGFVGGSLKMRQRYIKQLPVPGQTWVLRSCGKVIITSIGDTKRPQVCYRPPHWSSRQDPYSSSADEFVKQAYLVATPLDDQRLLEERS